MNGQSQRGLIQWQGRPFHILGEGALWLPAERTLVVADLHLEKGRHFAGQGSLLPLHDSLDTLHRLQKLAEKCHPARIVCLGDSFHSRELAAQFPPELLARLNEMVSSVPQWLWVLGNHDPDLPKKIGGMRCHSWDYGGIEFRHDFHPDGRQPSVAGHFHPRIRVRTGGISLWERCAVYTEQKLVLPAFGTYTGGLDICDTTFTDWLPISGRRVILLREGKVYPLPEGY